MSAWRAPTAAPYVTSQRAADVRVVVDGHRSIHRQQQLVAQRCLAHARDVRRIREATLAVDQAGGADTDGRAGLVELGDELDAHRDERGELVHRRRPASLAHDRAGTVEHDTEHLRAPDVESDGDEVSARRHRCGGLAAAPRASIASARRRVRLRRRSRRAPRPTTRARPSRSVPSASDGAPPRASSRSASPVIRTPLRGGRRRDGHP